MILGNVRTGFEEVLLQNCACKWFCTRTLGREVIRVKCREERNLDMLSFSCPREIVNCGSLVQNHPLIRSLWFRREYAGGALVQEL